MLFFYVKDLVGCDHHSTNFHYYIFHQPTSPTYYKIVKYSKFNKSIISVLHKKFVKYHKIKPINNNYGRAIALLHHLSIMQNVKSRLYWIIRPVNFFYKIKYTHLKKNHFLFSSVALELSMLYGHLKSWIHYINRTFEKTLFYYEIS